jgi:regulator of extracellular matrix RemA (YlzA/DUF370 family)
MMVMIGHGNYVKGDLVAVILQPDGAHAKKIRKNAEDGNVLINATSGHKTRSIIVLTTNQVVLSSLSTDVLKKRLDE